MNHNHSGSGNIIVAVLILSLVFVNSIAVCGMELSDHEAVDETEYREPDVYASIQSTISSLQGLREDVDYVRDEIIFFAGSEEEAVKISEEYKGELVSFHNGIGKAHVSEGVTEAFETAGISDVRCAAYPNYIRHICKERVIELSPLPSYEENGETTPSTSVNDPFVRNGWQWFHDSVNTIKARGSGCTGKGAVVAVLDTGISLSHNDLKGRIRKTKSYYNEGSVEDDHGHGSHCAGLIAAVADNKEGGMGVAPDAMLDIYKVADQSGSLLDEDITDAIVCAINDKVNVISMSFGDRSRAVKSLYEEAMAKAREAGILCVAAAGNDGENSSNYPAACSSVISVGAMIWSEEPELASYSNYGESVDVVAPGGANTWRGEIPTTAVNAWESDEIYDHSHQGILSTYKNGKYAIMSGTSMACPIVSGIAALVYAEHPGYLLSNSRETADAVKEIIISSTDKKIYKNTKYNSFNRSSERSVRGGLVQADRALEAPDPTADYLFMDETGVLGNIAYEYIARGKSLKLWIVPKGYEYKGKTEKDIKKLTGSAQWESDNPLISVKNGKIKCDKNAAEGTKAIISAEVDGKKLWAGFSVIEPVKKTGVVGSGSNTKLRKKIRISLSRNVKYDLYKPAALFNEKGYRLGAIFRSRGSLWKGYEDKGEFRYSLKLPGKTVNALDQAEESGENDKRMKFVRAGEYKVVYKLPYGCNKKFTVFYKVS